MRDIDACPLRENPYRELTPRGNLYEMANCKACADGIVVTHTLPRISCERCVRYQGVPNEFIAAVRARLLKTRILEARLPEGPSLAYRISVVNAWMMLKKGGEGIETLVELLDRAIEEHGCDPGIAATWMNAVEAG